MKKMATALLVLVSLATTSLVAAPAAPWLSRFYVTQTASDGTQYNVAMGPGLNPSVQPTYTDVYGKHLTMGAYVAPFNGPITSTLTVNNQIYMGSGWVEFGDGQCPKGCSTNVTWTLPDGLSNTQATFRLTLGNGASQGYALQITD